MKTRKGYKTILRLPDGEAQGMDYFEENGKIYLVVRISNIAYIWEYKNG